MKEKKSKKYVFIKKYTENPKRRHKKRREKNILLCMKNMQKWHPFPIKGKSKGID